MNHTSNSGPQVRYHSLDALKASMMSLGLVLHAAINYAQDPPATWGIRYKPAHVFFDLLFYFIHLFRMPVFFLVAGFFAALLFEKRGYRGLLSNRMKRVLLPLLLFGILLLPVNAFCFVFAARGGTWEAMAMAKEYVFSGQFLGDIHLAHLWFLYYLLYFYAFILLLRLIVQQLPDSFCRITLTVFEKLLKHKAGILMFMVLTFLTLLPMSSASLDTSTYLLPVPHILLAYVLFFCYGWMLYQRKELMNIYSERWKGNSLWAGCLSGMYLFLYTHPLVIKYQDLLLKAVASMALWLLIYAIMGLFIRFTNKNNSSVRYFSDASYWMYILHLPLTALLVGLLGPVSLSSFTKFAIVLSSTFLITVLSYHYLVRSTFVGVLLNGQRFPRVLPWKVTTSPKNPVETI